MTLKCEGCQDKLDPVYDSKVCLKTANGLKTLRLCKACKITMQNLCCKSGGALSESADAPSDDE